MTKIKICGITNLDDALAAMDAGAHALGFVLAEEGKKRNRYIAFPDAVRILERLPPFITTVAVTVNAPIDELAQYLTHFDMVQLHGDEPPEAVPLPHVCIKAFRAGPEFRISQMDAYEVRACLLDAHVPGEPGGTGQTFDWDIARAAAGMRTPLILAGGLTPENVAEAVRRVKPYAVDVSSGVEAAPGKKDHERIRSFINNVRAASVA